MALTRREFLAGGLSLSLGLTSFVENGAARGASLKAPLLKAAKTTNPVLVIVNLSGGNDAFNTVVPWSSNAYRKARPNLFLCEDQILKLNDELALAKPLAPLLKHFEAGKLAILPGVGLPDGISRSHSRASQIWHSAQPDILGKSGWIGRYLDGADRHEIFDFDTDHDNGLLFAGLSGPRPESEIKYIQAPSAYPQTKFGQSLATIAHTLQASESAAPAIFSVTLPGFDTHSNQKSRHEKLLAELASTLDAFMADLKTDANTSVMILVQSEFGRRLKENSGNIFSAPDMVLENVDSVGTDHGNSGLCFVLGHAVRGGIYGQYGDLDNLTDGEVAAGLDFRTVYATILAGHFGADSEAILGAEFKTLDFA